jgi:hypothetical protein
MNSGGDSSRRVRSLQELPRDIAPRHDLWPRIEAGLAPRRRPWVVPASLAASVLVATLAVMLGYRFLEAPAVPATQPEPSALLRAALVPGTTYERDRDKLLAALPAKLAQLSPETRQDVRDSLAAIQLAKQQLQSALGREAGNALLQELLIRMQRDEMRVLTTVEELDGFNPEI